ncbi:MAG: ornithine carbamoyltransferase [Clostridiaceae bacterium]|jgi:ornithine carbamoyltransferase|nr:ornithine carbamoyltransferase [Clostridiaceae bacterium]
MKHLLCLNDWTPDEIIDVLDLADKLKYENRNGIRHDHHLRGKTLGMIFSKSSTRTRVSFEVGMQQLGGYALFLSSADIQLGRGETVHDTAKTLSRYLDGIMIRTFKQKDVMDLAEYGTIPIVNGLTDELHPCQILADLMTIRERFGYLKGLKLAYVGDGNNVAHSLLVGCAKTGINISVATPDNYSCDTKYIEMARKIAEETGSVVEITTDARQAVNNADVVYTDTWVSMGMENEREERIKIFTPYQVNENLMSLAKPGAIFLHCLPAYRGFEVTEEVIDGPQSAVFDEAENRLHVQKAVLVKLMA